MSTDLLLARLSAAGLSPAAVRTADEGFAAVSGFATLADGREVFAKTLPEPASGLFASEAEGLGALRGAALGTPDVLHVSDELLVLSLLAPRPDTTAFWERLAGDVASLHTSTTHERFGWPHDGWLGAERQDNAWHDDGFAFFAECRVLRWLPEPRVQAKLEPVDQDALERLCAALPQLLPVRPACLTHGDFWMQNILATAAGLPAVIDPAVSYAWADVDLAHLWSTPRPPAAERFFAVYAEITGEQPGWTDRLAYVQLRQHLALMAMFDDDWGSTDAVRDLVRSFRRRP
ncbi:fructosamine-3-kinase [Motilibacter rhizosphaerae]|uniref:Fructosamine-3-kinase n=1 Tax=Motilibacter rhizosphaerae TaxID=598652 RepID=A0A4Q7NAZ9_9ACTN|nr:fructosamine kinase family protein [Motilibacter rhizosphaerae]RZS80132.1 fructosamine-3-kinase [Motilibacter rhizosphaerae]